MFKVSIFFYMNSNCLLVACVRKFNGSWLTVIYYHIFVFIFVYDIQKV